jgi:hypothetical protein
MLEQEASLSAQVIQRLSRHCDSQEQLQVHILDFMLRRGYIESAQLYCE